MLSAQGFAQSARDRYIRRLRLERGNYLKISGFLPMLLIYNAVGAIATGQRDPAVKLLF